MKPVLFAVVVNPMQDHRQRVYVFTMWFCILSFLSLLVPAPKLLVADPVPLHVASSHPSKQTLGSQTLPSHAEPTDSSKLSFLIPNNHGLE